MKAVESTGCSGFMGVHYAGQKPLDLGYALSDGLQPSICILGSPENYCDCQLLSLFESKGRLGFLDIEMRETETRVELGSQDGRSNGIR